jgi:TyrR family helix-turn-helix protein
MIETKAERTDFESHCMEMKMTNKYGINRVLEPKHVLTTSAWKVDNNRDILPNEMRVSLRRLHIDPTSFKQICLEANNDEVQIKEKIIDITIRRGKLHNPVTDTGGLLYGIIEEIGAEYPNSKGFKIGDEVICNASLATIPLYISRITKIDKAYTQIEAEGYAIAFDALPVVRKPEGVPTELLLFIFNESGTLYRISKTITNQRKFLVVGNNIIMNMLFGYVIRKIAGENVEVVCLFDKKTNIAVRGKTIDNLLAKLFNEIHYVDILKPIECLDRLNAYSLFDLSINCADIPGAETINVLATKSGGTVFFAHLINNYNIALYITESIARQLEIRCADGYLEEYDEFDIEIVKELAPYLKDAVWANTKIEDDLSYPLNKNERLSEASRNRKALAEDFVCESRAMTSVLNEVLNVSKYDCNVLIAGETGVGKDKVAAIIQKNSARNMQPFIKINCAAIAPNLMESEFFGYEKGSFTGASALGKKGYFELADNGTIFLDEIGELPLDIQAKLLRVIQDGEFYKVGGTFPIKTNVRIFSATNRNIETLIEKKLFRRDLYYRLNVFPVKVPSLKERSSDIPALIMHFVEKYGGKFGIEKTIEEDAVEYLKKCKWPGNIRELENVIQRLLIGAKNRSITLADVMHELHGDVFGNIEVSDFEIKIDDTKEFSLKEMVNNYERNVLSYAYEKYGSTRKAAKAIGISQTQFIRKQKAYGNMEANADEQ